MQSAMNQDFNTEKMQLILQNNGVSIVSEQPLAITIGLNRNSYDQALKRFNEQREVLQQIVDVVMTVKNVDKITISDLTGLLANPSDFIANKILSEKPVIGGIQIMMDKVFSLIGRPPQLDRIESLIAKSEFKNPNTISITKQFEIKKGSVQIKPSFLEYLEEQHTKKYHDVKAADYINLLTIEHDLNEYLSSKQLKPNTFLRSNLMRVKGDKLTLNKEILVNPNRVGVSF